MDIEDARAPTDGEYLRAFARRNRWVFVICSVLALVAALAFLMLKPPKYEATAAMLLQPQATSGDANAVATPATPELVRSQFAIIQSQQVLDTVVRKLKLDHDRAFTRGAPSGATPQQNAAAARDKLAKELKVDNDGRSYTIYLSARADSAARAALITNTLAATYIDAERQQKVHVLQSTRAALGAQLSDLRARTIQAEAAAEQFRQQTDLLPLSSLPEDGESYQNSTPASREIVEMARAAAALTVDDASAQGKYAAQQRAIRRGRGAATAEVLASPVVTQLREQEAQFAQQESDLLTKYTPNHPRVRPVHAQLVAVRGAIAEEIGRIHASVRSRAEASSIARDKAKAMMGELEGRRNHDLAASVKLRQLTREAQLSRDTYEQFATQMQRATERAALQLPDVLLVSSATPPLRPSGLPRPILILLFLLGGLLVAVPISLYRSLRPGARVEAIEPG